MSLSIYSSIWRPQPPTSLSNLQRYWLKRPGILTKGLRQVGSLKINVLKECIESLSLEESLAINQPINTPVWVREIVMRIDDIPCVWARSLTPLTASHSTWKGIRRLNTRPLAEILYHDPTIQRSAFEVASIYRSTQIARSQRKYFPTNKELSLNYARRSIFYKKHQPLMVIECFLPAFWQLLEHRPNLAYY